MLKNNLSKLVVAVAIMAVLVPGMALAHGKNAEMERHDDAHHNNKGLHLGQFKGLVFSGEVLTVTNSGFTFKTKDDVTLTANTSAAKIVRIPKAVISNSDIKVGDRVHVIGVKTNNTIAATMVYDMTKGDKLSKAKGTVTAATDHSLTVLTKGNKTITVNTDGDTKIMDKDGNKVAMADIDAGAKVKLSGVWNTILNVFNAIKVRVF